MANGIHGALVGAGQAQQGRASVLGGAIARLSGNLTGLEGVLTTLEQRLEGVLLARVPKTVDSNRAGMPQPVPDAASPVVGLLNEQAERVAMLTAETEDLLNRLQA